MRRSRTKMREQTKLYIQPYFQNGIYTGYTYLMTKEQMENDGDGAEVVIKAPLEQIEITNEIDIISYKERIPFISIKIFENLLIDPVIINLPFYELASTEAIPKVIFK
jgi:hypothetical protein